MDTAIVVLLSVVALACLGILGMAVFLLVRLVRVYRSAKELPVSLGPKAAFWGAIAYFFMPLDLLPDPIYLDDVGLLMAALSLLGKAAAEARQKVVTGEGRVHGDGC
ncbi:YkvA family protein [Streptomyces sanyensis]|uniref:YkvA family protein n=1 Tax=Streptomyces sanyensis TaxID=568869 RepID=UPI003D786CD3